jgi:hypothetical protein
MFSSARARRRISVAHLVGQFARGAQHQRLHRKTARIQVGQQCLSYGFVAGPGRSRPR